MKFLSINVKGSEIDKWCNKAFLFSLTIKNLQLLFGWIQFFAETFWLKTQKNKRFFISFQILALLLLQHFSYCKKKNDAICFDKQAIKKKRKASKRTNTFSHVLIALSIDNCISENCSRSTVTNRRAMKV